MTLDPHGNIIVTGYTEESENQLNWALIGYDNYGNQRFVIDYNGPGNDVDVAIDVITDLKGCIYITGYTTGIDTDWDYTTIKYSSVMGIRKEGNLSSPENYLSQNFPNPFNLATTIPFTIDKTSNIALKIFNPAGEIVRMIINNQTMIQGNYHLIWDGKNDKGKLCSSGVYFYKLEINDRREIKKCILLKIVYIHDVFKSNIN